MVIVAPSGFERLPILDNPLRIPGAASPVSETLSRRIETSGTIESSQSRRHPASFLLQADDHAGSAEAASPDPPSDGSFLTSQILSASNIWLAASLPEQDQQSLEKNAKADSATVARLYENARPVLGAKLMTIA